MEPRKRPNVLLSTPKPLTYALGPHLQANIAVYLGPLVGSRHIATKEVISGFDRPGLHQVCLPARYGRGLDVIDNNYGMTDIL